MAELADALDSGSSEGNFMQVQFLLSAPKSTSSEVLFLFLPKVECRLWAFFILKCMQCESFVKSVFLILTNGHFVLKWCRFKK